MVSRQLSVGVRLPLASPSLSPTGLLDVCQAAHALGYQSIWLGDHVVLPEQHSSPYPHSADRLATFSADTPWVDPLLTLGWLSARLPATMRIGTSVMILPLRNPVLLAKQLSTLSWLAERDISFGVGSGWLREEYEAVGALFDGRATEARRAIRTIRRLLTEGGAEYSVSIPGGGSRTTRFTMLPRAPHPVTILWGGVSPTALRLVAAVCDGWLPAKKSLEELPPLLDRLRAECDDVGRDFDELRLVAKPGPGPDPGCDAITRESIEVYKRLGFHEVVLELPYESGGPARSIEVLERVAKRSNL